MLSVLITALYIFLLAAVVGAIFYSIRYRRLSDPVLRGINAARMNMHLGAALMALGFLVMTMPFSITRTVICCLFFVLGLFNLFAGFRNYGAFSRLRHRQERKSE